MFFLSFYSTRVLFSSLSIAKSTLEKSLFFLLIKVYKPCITFNTQFEFLMRNLAPGLVLKVPYFLGLFLSLHT